MKHINPISLIIFIVTLNGCASISRADTSVGIKTVLSGAAPENDVLGNRKIEFINTQDSFEKTVANYSTVPQEKIDFSANQVILLAMGEKPTGGYAIRVDGVEEINGALKLIATEAQPGSNCMVTQVLTAPYLFVKVSSVKRVETVVFKSEVVDCTAP
jgi:hypothetical protein